MSLISRGHGYPLTPPRETRNVPDQTRVIATLANIEEVVSIHEVKEFLPIRHGNYNTTIQRLIKAVTNQVEDYIRQDVLKKRVESYWKRTPEIARLSRGPHGDILSVKVIDENGNETTLSEGVNYKVKGMKYKSLHNFNQFGELYIEYESGVLPDDIKDRVSSAVMQEISLQFKNRQDPDTPGMTSVNNLSLEARHLLSGVVRRAL